MNSNANFYKNIPSFSDSSEISNLKNYQDVPRDWVIFLTDVQGSTKAIEEGRYKDVNLVGVSGITAVKNACSDVSFPYVFGGDGATFLIPPEKAASVRAALLGTRQMAMQQFAFNLRIGEISLSDVNLKNQNLKVGKYQVSPSLELAVFSGGALGAAETLVKDSTTSKAYLLDAGVFPEADFTGLECRWQPLQSEKGKILSVLVKATPSSARSEEQIYREIIAEIDEVLGATKFDKSPVNQKKMNTIVKPADLISEYKIRTQGKSFFNKVIFFLSVYVGLLLSKMFFVLRLKVSGTDWGQYQNEVISNSDFWKYDEMLRFVADVNPVQQKILTLLLQDYLSRKEIFYGLHISQTALMTCMVFSRQGEHVHFIDGGEGGYAMAAKQLKSQIKDRVLDVPVPVQL